MSRTIVVISAILLICVFSGVSRVLACSGGPPPWSRWLPQLIEDSDVIVIGQYVELDDAQANGIFQVHDYLNGAGNEYLVIHASDVRAIENSQHANRSYYHINCNMFAPVSLNTTGLYIYFLNHQVDGTYSVHHRRYFADEAPTTTVSENPGEVIEINVAELTRQITDQAGHEPQKPNPDAPYPRTTPILLTTTNNQHFLLPVDTTNLVSIPNADVVDLRREQHECSSPPCAVYSPNGLDKVYLRSEEDEPHRIGDLLPYTESNAVGDRIVFSATSETYALWSNDQIQLYMLWYPNLGYPDDWLETLQSIELINTIPAGNSIRYPVAWSPDGRTMAFSTDEGLWLWDALTFDSSPYLLIETKTDIPIARYFSPQGRYLAVTEGNERYNLDLVSDLKLPDGFVSPDDRMLLAFDTSTESPTTLDVMYLAPGIRRFEYYPEVEFLDVQWIDNLYFVAAISGSSYLRYELGEPYEYDTSGEIVYEAIPYVVDEPFYDVVKYHSSGIHWIQHDLQVPYGVREVQMKDFSYSPGPGLIELGVDGFHITVNRDLISLTSSLSEPIINAVWLPSAFYYEDK